MSEVNINFMTNGKLIEWPTNIIINITIANVFTRD